MTLGLALLYLALGRRAAFGKLLKGTPAALDDGQRLALGIVELADKAGLRHQTKLDTSEFPKGVHALDPKPRRLLPRCAQARLDTRLLGAQLCRRLLDLL